MMYAEFFMGSLFSINVRSAFLAQQIRIRNYDFVAQFKKINFWGSCPADMQKM